MEQKERFIQIKKAVIPLGVSAGVLMGGVSHNTETYAVGSSHIQNVSSSEHKDLIGRPDLPNKIFIPGLSSGEDTIQAGVNTHLAYENEAPGFVDLQGFKNQVDLVSSYGLSEIRFGIPRWEVAKLSDSHDAIVWNDSHIHYFKEAVKYAEEKGLAVYFPTAPPEVPDGFPLDKYLEITRTYYEKIGKEFPSVIHQPGNEYDTHNIFNYGLFKNEDGEVRQLNDSELEIYRQWLETAAKALRSNNPLIQVTQSLSGYPMGTHKIQEWMRINDVIGKYVDFLSLDTYPRNIEEAKAMPAVVQGFTELTGKQVVITEVGMPTYGDYSEMDQAHVVPAAIKAYKEAGFTVLLYSIQDEENTVLPHPKTHEQEAEEEFGILDEHGKEKKAFSPVIDALNDPTSN